MNYEGEAVHDHHTLQKYRQTRAYLVSEVSTYNIRNSWSVNYNTARID